MQQYAIQIPTAIHTFIDFYIDFPFHITKKTHLIFPTEILKNPLCFTTSVSNYKFWISMK